MADISQVKLPNGDTYNLVDETSGYIKNYTETDPVFAASAAAGITATDINNWNAKVSDDKTWNGVSLNKTENTSTGTKYIPTTTGTTSTSMNYTRTNATGLSIQGGQIPQYDTNGYLYVETPDADAGFRTVVNKSYVDSKIPSQYVYNVEYNTVQKELNMTRNSTSVTIVTTATLKSDMAYSNSNTNGFLTMSDLPIYDGTVE